MIFLNSTSSNRSNMLTSFSFVIVPVGQPAKHHTQQSYDGSAYRQRTISETENIHMVIAILLRCPKPVRNNSSKMTVIPNGFHEQLLLLKQNRHCQFTTCQVVHRNAGTFLHRAPVDSRYHDSIEPIAMAAAQRQHVRKQNQHQQ